MNGLPALPDSERSPLNGTVAVSLGSMHGKHMPALANGREVCHRRVANVCLEHEAGSKGGQELEMCGARILVERVVEVKAQIRDRCDPHSPEQVPVAQTNRSETAFRNPFAKTL